MSARWKPFPLLAAVLLGTIGWAGSVAAKPPGLPVDPSVECRETLPEEGFPFGGSLLFGVPDGQEEAEDGPSGVIVLDFGTGRMLVVELGPTSGVELGVDCSPCCEVEAVVGPLMLLADLFGVGPEHEEIEVLAVAPVEQAEHVTCPYLQSKAAKEAARTEEDGLAAFPSVTDNLENLNRARKLYRRAERCRREGQTEEACTWYEQVQALCPGSRYDRLAAAKLHKLHARRASDPSEEATAPEEERPTQEGLSKKVASPEGQDCCSPSHPAPFPSCNSVKKQTKP